MRTSWILCLLATACSGHHLVGFTGAPDDAGAPEDAMGADDGPVLEDSAPLDATPSEGGCVNLIANGDFENGNTLFGSDYTYTTPTNTVEGEYTVGKSGEAFNSWLVDAGDHTSGKGLMFIGNGKATADRVWFPKMTIQVQPNTQYFFEGWVMNLCCGGSSDPQGPSVLSFYANDELLATRTSKKLGQWEGMTTTWKSEAATTVKLKLVNANTAAWGNDFAVDDISLCTTQQIPTPNTN